MRAENSELRGPHVLAWATRALSSLSREESKVEITHGMARSPKGGSELLKTIRFKFLASLRCSWLNSEPEVTSNKSISTSPRDALRGNERKAAALRVPLGLRRIQPDKMLPRGRASRTRSAAEELVGASGYANRFLAISITGS